MRTKALAALLSVVLWAGAASGQQTGKVSVTDTLGALAPATERRQVVVLGTPHLRTLGKELQPKAAERLLAVLEAYRPDVVCVEFMPPEAIVAMEGQGGDAAEILGAFAKRALDWGRFVRKQTGETPQQAAARAAEYLRQAKGLSAEDRIRLTGQLLASYDYPSALLQWAYVPEQDRRSTALIPENVREGLEGALHEPTETGAVSVPTARRLNLQRLVSIDDHFDDERLQSVPEAELEALMADPRAKAAASAAVYTDLDARVRAANAAGDLLPAYRYINSPAYLSKDLGTQWALFLRTRLASGVDRYRYALWEARNMKIAANIAATTSERGTARVLVVIGAAHKPFLEEYLGRLVGVRVRQLEELARAR